MSNYPPQRDWAGVIGPWLAILAFGAAVVARFIGLENADENKTKIIARLESEVDDLKRERAKTAETLGRIDVRIEGLTDDVREVKAETREINGKLSKRGR